MVVQASWCRDQAAECAAQAERTTNRQVQIYFKNMVASWLRIAEAMEQADFKLGQDGHEPPRPPASAGNVCTALDNLGSVVR